MRLAFTFVAAATAAALLAVPELASAQEAAPGSFGLGVVVGSPTGVSAKLKVSRANSFDAAVGLGFGNTFHVHANWLYEMPALLREEGVTLSWFAGLGGRFSVHDRDDRGRGNDDDDDDDDEDDDDVDLGPRVPVGLELRFSNVPQLELFAEIAPGLEVADDTGLFLDGGIGARWFF